MVRSYLDQFWFLLSAFIHHFFTASAKSATIRELRGRRDYSADGVQHLSPVISRGQALE